LGASPYDPINVYKPLAPDIGIVDGPFEYLIVAGIRLPLPFTTRMTVVRLSNGDLFLHSPIKFNEGLANELRRLGRVRHLVSPNQFHYAHIGEWAKAFRLPLLLQRRKATAAIERVRAWRGHWCFARHTGARSSRGSRYRPEVRSSRTPPCARPSAGVRQALTIRLDWFSIKALSKKGEFRLHASSLSVKSGFRVRGRGVCLVGALPALEGRFVARAVPGLKLFIEPQASINVPSTEKCSLDISFLTAGCARTAARSFAAIAPSSRWSRFFENTVAPKWVRRSPDRRASETTRRGNARAASKTALVSERRSDVTMPFLSVIRQVDSAV
jgi:hypothetical protein